MIQKSTAPKGGKREGVFKNHSLILAFATPMMIMTMKFLVIMIIMIIILATHHYIVDFPTQLTKTKAGKSAISHHQ